jgi:inosine-uridine nucleoside N-ribohydrolase
MAVALKEEIVTSASEHWMDVETESALTLGMTVVDRLNVAEDERNRKVWARKRGRKAKIVWEIKNEEWKAELFARLR